MTFPEPGEPAWDFAWGRLQDVLLEHFPQHTLDDYFLMCEQEGTAFFKHRDTKHSFQIDITGKLIQSRKRS